MLRRVRVSGFSLLRNAEVEFGAGLTVITGESGAGKSLLLDAVSFALGARPNRSLLAQGSQSCEVELTLDLEAAKAAALGSPWKAGENMISRKYHSSGRSTARINGESAALQVLRDGGEALIEIAGQFESRVLFNPQSHLQILDRFGDAKLEAAKDAYATAYESWKECQARLAALHESAASREHEIDFLKFQVDELGKAAVEQGDKALVEAELRTAENAEQIIQSSLGAAAQLSGDDEAPGAYELLAEARQEVETLQRIMGEDSPGVDIGDLLDRLDSAMAEVGDCAAELQNVGGNVSADPEQVNVLRARLDLINSLERKYGVDGDELAGLLQEKSQRLSWLTDEGQSPEELELKVVALRKTVQETGEKLSKQRASASRKLVNAATSVLKQLEFAQVELLVDAEPLEEPAPSGLENVEFLVTLNPGEPARPLALVASGGEASRLMLGLKAALSDKLDYMTVFLDEIEAGLGGKAAESLAEVLYDMSRARQVIAVTHLPLVAARGERHLLVTKAIDAAKASAGIEELTAGRRKDELARMLGDEGGAEEHALVSRLLQARPRQG